MKKNIIKINNDLIQIIITKTGTSISQILSINKIFSNHIHEKNKGKQDITQRHIILIFNHKTQWIHKFTNQLKCKMKSHYHIIYSNTK